MIRRRKTSTGLRRFFGVLFSLMVILGLVVVAAGAVRYGGPLGLWRRVQAEVAARQPHPQHVPTPLTVSAPVQAVALAQVPSQTLLIRAAAPLRTPTATRQPAAAVLLPTVTPTPPLHTPMKAAMELTGFRHQWQTWNNCGPATLAMQLSYFGSSLDQSVIGQVLRTNPDDKNVNPDELAAYARAQGYEAKVLVNGNIDRLRLLLSNGLPVLVETWLEDEPNDGMGHYRLLVGYDDRQRHWLAYDSYDRQTLRNSNGPYRGITLPYATFDPLWKVFNRTYLLVYPAEQAPLVASIVGDDLDAQQMWARALNVAQVAVTQQPRDPFAWFNLGSTLVALGYPAEAAAAYDQARLLGLPWRMLWYQFGPFQAYHAVGRPEEVLALADATIATTKSVEEVFYWRGEALAALGDLASARQAWQYALQLNPRYADAQIALDQTNQ
jgi:tetratricopeptide (TPR) repeat protein